jgi:cell division protein ZapA (FtsZ GTPase activity inhibitor)
MKTMKFWIFGREFGATCDDGQEARLQQLIARLKERIDALSAGTPATKRDVFAQMQTLVLAAITFADEFQDARDALNRLQHELRPAFIPQPAPAQTPPAQLPDPAAVSAHQQALEQLDARLATMEQRLLLLASQLES